jgi:uncharacterized membrane protein
MSTDMLATLLILVAFVLGLIEVVQSRGQALLPWAVVLLALALLVGRL